ncbi:MAG: hypothetical protein Q9209_006117 [Squamulea sp. 1 TL-2023]
MSSYQEDFYKRRPEPQYNDPDAYLRDRNALYPGRGHGGGPGYPPPSMTNGFDAHASQAKKDIAQRNHQQANRAYAVRRDQSTATIASMNRVQREYYQMASAGRLPTDHAALKPLALTNHEAALAHARAREETFYGAPMLYDTAASQIEHHRHIGEHYGHSDAAMAKVQHHADFEHDPSSSARDCYKREVPHGRQPMKHPYPYRNPEDGYYSSDLNDEPPAFVIAQGKKKKSRGRN